MESEYYKALLVISYLELVNVIYIVYDSKQKYVYVYVYG